jgi:DNA primase
MGKSWVDFATVKRIVTMRMLIERYGVKVHKSGKELRGRCPIHKGEGENSFSVNTDKNIFNCFSCNAKGNILEFVAAMEQCSIRDAALRLAEWYSIESNPERTKTSRGSRREKPAQEKEAVGESSEPNKPLAFRLRAIDSAHQYLTGRGIDQETTAYFGAGLFSGKGSMNGRLVIPIENESGELIAYAGRSIDGSEPKYKLPAGFKKSQVLFNLARARDDSSGTVVLVEGFFDCMKITQAEFPCVALMGCSLSDEQMVLLADHFKQVVILLDGDEAGRSAADEIAAQLVKKLFVRIVDVGQNRQPDQLSKEEIQSLLAHAF